MQPSTPDVLCLPKVRAGYVKRSLVGLVDGAVAIVICLLLFNYQRPWFLYHWLENLNGSLLVLLVLIVYRLLSLLIFNRTIGTYMFRVELLNGDEGPLNVRDKALAAVFVLYRGVDYYLK